jgi:nucleotide-binding universal stress UspA family protein
MAYEPMGPVIVGVDGSPVSMRALDLAAEEAVARVTPLEVVHVLRSAAARADALVVGRQLLAVAEGRVASEHPCLGVTTELVIGHPADALVARSGGASLVVVGHRGSGGGHGLPIGSVALSVAGRSTAPVLVYRPLISTRDVPSPRPVVVGVNPAEPMDTVTEFAFAEASMRGAPLLAIGVSEMTDPHSLTETLAAWASKYDEVTVTTQIKDGGDVGDLLTQTSRNAQLIVVGSSKRGRLPQLVLGAVSQALLERAACPVIVIPRS